MNLTKRIFAAFLVLVLFISTMSVTAFAAGDIKYGIGFTTGTSLRLRAEASTSSKVIDTASDKGEVVVVVSQVDDWYKVIYNLQEGYMHSKYVSVLTKENAELGYGKVNGTSVNLRQGAGTSHKKVAVADKGDQVYIIGINEGWYKVIYGSKVCYIRSDFVDLTEIPYENPDSSKSPKFFRGGKSTGVTPSASALNGSASTESTGSNTTTTKPNNNTSTSKPNNTTTSAPNNSASSKPDNSTASKPSNNAASPSTNNTASGNTVSSNVSGSSIVSTAEKYLGTRYVYGGASPSGFDCSGFVYYVLNSLGIKASRTLEPMYKQGTPISKSELQPGDIVFFQNTYKVGLSHVGIYVGNGRFIHAPSTGRVVSYAELNSTYYINHYYGAVRFAK